MLGDNFFYWRSGIGESAVEMGIIGHVPRWAYSCVQVAMLHMLY